MHVEQMRMRLGDYLLHDSPKRLIMSALQNIYEVIEVLVCKNGNNLP